MRPGSIETSFVHVALVFAFATMSQFGFASFLVATGLGLAKALVAAGIGTLLVLGLFSLKVSPSKAMRPSPRYKGQPAVQVLWSTVAVSIYLAGLGLARYLGIYHGAGMLLLLAVLCIPSLLGVVVGQLYFRASPRCTVRSNLLVDMAWKPSLKFK